MLKISKTSWFIILSAFVVFIIDIWVEHSEEAASLYKWMKPFVDEPKFSIIWTAFVIVLFTVAIRELLQKHDAEKAELVRRMKSEMELLVEANQQLNQFRIRDVLRNKFTKFLEQQTYVVGVQLYSYSMKHLFGRTTVKVSFVDGVVTEKVDINAMQQVYYTFDTSMYREFVAAREVLDVNPDLMVEFIQRYNHRLSVKPLKDLTKEDAVIYAFVTLGAEILEVAVNPSIKPKRELYLDPEKIFILDSQQRTGILRAILVRTSPYSFTHTKENEKLDRQYIASVMKLNEENFVYMLILDAEILSDPNRKKHMVEIPDAFEARF